MTFIILLLSLLSPLSFAESPSEPSPNLSVFSLGLSYYESKDFDRAIVEFDKALQQKPNNPSILTNLALAHFQKNEKGQAIAYFRRALWVDPDFGPAANGLNFLLSQLEVKEIPHRIESYESFRRSFLAPVSPWLYPLLGSFLFFFGGWLIIRYLSARKKALAEELSLPPFPTVGSFFLFFFLISTSFALLKFYDLKQTRGTIIVSQAKVLAAPDEKASSLYEIPEGLEVIVQRSQNDWLQITYPGGMTGWVPARSVYATNAH